MTDRWASDGCAAFHAAMFGRLSRELWSVVGADAEDIAQEALVVACQRWADVARLDVPEAWVRRVALRMASRRARRESARGTVERSADRPRPSPGPDLDLVAALLDLPDRHAVAVRLHHLEDRPIAEVADLVGCSEGAAKVLLVRARRLLAERLRGISGRWVTEHTWTIDGYVRYLRAAGYADRIEAVVDGDMGGRGGRLTLTVADGSYELRRDDGARFDHGMSRVDAVALEMAPTLNVGRARYRARVEGRRLTLAFEDATIPPFLGLPEGVWGAMFFDVAPFVRENGDGRR